MLAPGGEIEGPSPHAALSIESRALYRDFVRELEQASGVSIDYQECGALDLAYSEEELQGLEAKAARQAALGIQSTPVAPERVATFWPRVRKEQLAGGRFYPGDALVNPRDILTALQTACTRLNVTIRAHSSVSRIALAADKVTVTARQDEKTYQAVIVAAGAWSNAIEILGAPPLPCVEPVRGHLIGYTQPEQVCNTMLRHGSAYLLQRASGLLIAGSTMEHVGFDRHIDPELVRGIASRAGFILPHLLETAPSETWIGFRPGSDHPHLGSWHSPRLFLAYGHFRNGILLAPATARRLTEEIDASLQTR